MYALASLWRPSGVPWRPSGVPLVFIGLRCFCMAGVGQCALPRGRMYALASLWRPSGVPWAPLLLRGRRGTMCTAKGSDVRPGVPLASLWCPLGSAAFAWQGSAAFAWQAWDNVSLLSASSLLCFSSVHIVGSLASKLPSIILILIIIIIILTVAGADKTDGVHVRCCWLVRQGAVLPICPWPGRDWWREKQANQCLPLYIHGDEGVTYKKQGVLILSWQSPLGYGTSRRPREMSITLEAMGESGLPMNFLKSGMYSKMLTIVCQKDRGQNPFHFCWWSFENMLTLEKETWYPGTVRGMVQEWPANLESNFWDGLPAFCCVGEGWYRFGSPQRSRHVASIPSSWGNK